MKHLFLASALFLVGLSSARAEELPVYNLTIQGGRFQPDTLEVKAEQRFKLIISNKGPEAEEFESTELRKEKVLAPGVTSFLVFAPLKPGAYRFFGEFHPGTAQGRIVAR